MDALIQFLESQPGRGLRMSLGVVLIVLGVVFIPGIAGYLVTLMGIEPLFAGLAGVCLLAPLFGYNIFGERIPDTAW